MNIDWKDALNALKDSGAVPIDDTPDPHTRKRARRHTEISPPGLNRQEREEGEDSYNHRELRRLRGRA